MKDISPEIKAIADSYRYPKPPDLLVALQDQVSRLLRLLVDWLDSLHIDIPGLADTKAVGNVMQLILYGAGVPAALIVIGLVFSRLRQLQRQTRLSRRGPAEVEVVLDAGGWRLQSERLAAGGHWRESCRALYLSLLHVLDERGIAELAPTKTNYEYLYTLAAHPPVQQPFRKLVQAVETVWFGQKEASESDYRSCLAALEEVIGEVEQVPRHKLLVPPG